MQPDRTLSAAPLRKSSSRETPAYLHLSAYGVDGTASCRKSNVSALQALSPRPPERVAAGAACNTDRRGLRPEAVSAIRGAEAS